MREGSVRVASSVTKKNTYLYKRYELLDVSLNTTLLWTLKYAFKSNLQHMKEQNKTKGRRRPFDIFEIHSSSTLNQAINMKFNFSNSTTSIKLHNHIHIVLSVYHKFTFKASQEFDDRFFFRSIEVLQNLRESNLQSIHTS